MTEWKGNSQVFRTYVKGDSSGDGKAPAKGTRLKGKKSVLSYDEAEQNDSFGGLLQEGVIDISFDSEDLSEKFWNMADAKGWECLILENPTNGHIHSFWKIPEGWSSKDGRDKKLAVGLLADIHSKDTYIPLRVKGSDRFPPSYEPDELQEVPEELFPVNTSIDLLNMTEGEGRNDSLFRYILVLQGMGFEDDTIKGILKNTNEYVLSDPLSEQEFETITRKESFAKPVFFKGKTFMFNVFGDYLIRNYHMVKLDGKIHIYNEGVYSFNLNQIERIMLKEIPTLADTKRKEVLKYLSVMCPEVYPSSARFIAFRNGVLNIETGELLPFSPEYIITNRIPWDYNPSAYSEIADKTLNKIACDDKDIRSLLEECIGYCFYRKNILQKSFILIGDKHNGKSTFIKCLNRILGDDNISAMDLKNLGDRFSKATLFKKLANIGDDISDDFIPDPSLFKKIVSGDRIQAEFKGQDAFEFNPYVKLVFSANNLPRIKDKTGAVLRRLEIIPFNANFSEDDPDHDKHIQEKLDSQQSVEYLIMLGVEGLKRILPDNRGFTKSQKVKKELDDYEEYNNPVLGFIRELDEEEILNHEPREVFVRYGLYCSENGFLSMTQAELTKAINRELGTEALPRKIPDGNGGRKTVRLFIKK